MQVVIPIGVGSNWENNELRYCLRSLKHCKFDVEPIILADEGVSIPWLTNVVCVPITRFYPQGLETEYGAKFFENYFSVLDKVRWFCHQDFCGDDFLLFSDDYLLLKDVDDPRLFENNALGKNNTSKLNKTRRTRHEKTILEALELAHQEKHCNGLAEYEIHAPRFYNKARLLKIFNRHPLEKQKTPYALATLYYNSYYDEPKCFVKDESCRIVCYCHFDDGYHQYMPDTISEMDYLADKYYMLSYQDKGLNVSDGFLKRWIISAYPDKCKYEL